MGNSYLECVGCGGITCKDPLSLTGSHLIVNNLKASWDFSSTAQVTPFGRDRCALLWKPEILSILVVRGSTVAHYLVDRETLGGPFYMGSHLAV